jgi:hypothetical protein
MAKKPPIQQSEITRDNLMSDEAILFLGAMAAKSLELFGQVTFLMSGSGGVAVANPVHVYLDTSAWLDDDARALPKYRYVRPVLGQGKPQYVAWKNGELWEIEFEDEPQPAKGG